MSTTVCDRHPGAVARDTCRRCGRAVCLACAIPVRGEILCPECVREELGADVPAGAGPAPPRVSPWGGALFLATALVAMLPWDSSGERTGWFSALSLRPDPWPLIAVAFLVAAGVLGLRRVDPRRPRRWGHLAAGVLGLAAVLVATPAPEFATRSPVPYLVLGLGALAVAMTVLRMARRERPITSAPVP